MSEPILVLAAMMAIYVPVLVSPGPNFLIVTQTAVNQSRRHAIYAALGVSSASTILAAIAATGIGILVASLPWFHQSVQILGGLYLLYFGVKIWRDAARPLTAPSGVAANHGLRQAYYHGLATNLSNPKALVFFATIFASMITPDSAGWLKISGVIAICAASSTWHLALANWFSGERMQRTYRDAKAIVSRVTACVLIAFGASLLWQWLVGR
ncbi:MAG TPA: LysE family transporter [Burkholderiaceae bacterium]|jgi:threonine/homoserine/homoserine lactone efflux protein